MSSSFGHVNTYLRVRNTLLVLIYMLYGHFYVNLEWNYNETDNNDTVTIVDTWRGGGFADIVLLYKAMINRSVPFSLGCRDRHR